MELMDIRRSILFDTPYTETVSGNPVNFFTDRGGKAKSCIVKLNFIQSGEGTPSLDNLRPFVPHEGVTLNNNGVITNYPYGDMYDGYVDIVNGLYYLYNLSSSLTGSYGWSVVADHKFYATLPSPNRAGASTTFEEQFCNMYPFDKVITGGSTSVTEDKHFYIQRTPDTNHPEWNRVWVYDTDYTLDSFKAMLNETPLQFTYSVAPYVYQLPTSWVTVKRGYNSISSPDGEIYSLKYWTRSALPSGYKQVESIWSYKYGGQIDTGVEGNDNTLKIEATFMCDFWGQYVFLFGNHKNEESNSWRVLHGGKDDGSIILTGNRKSSGGSGVITLPNGFINRKVTVTLTYTSVSINEGGNTYTLDVTNKSVGLENSNKICIGNGNYNPNSSFNTSQIVTWYGFRIWRGTALIRDYVPCVRTSDNKVGFYDKVNYTFNPSTAKSEFFLFS